MISVIMGVYNGETTVAESVKSIMASTVKDIEFIICDDGSTDRTREILEAFARDDARIKLIFNGRNEGLAYSLNCCLAIASGNYIARQDADDISHSERLERQRDFLDHHSEFGFVGTSARLIHNGEMWGIRRYPRDVDEAMLSVGNMFIHPTLMFRREVLTAANGYFTGKEALRCEDYELLMRLYGMGVKGYNMQECYLDYREDPAEGKHHSWKMRLDEVKVRFRGAKLMKTGLKGKLYAFRPIALMLLPKKIYVKMRKKRWAESPDDEKGAAKRTGFKQSMYVLSSLVRKNIKNQYRRSVLGILWTILNPLLNMIVLALVFSQLLGRDLPGVDYPLYILTGNMIFGLLRQATVSALPSLVDSYDLLTKTRISFYVFPTSHSAASLVNFAFSFVAMIAVMLVRIPNGVKFYWTILMTVPLLPALLLFSMGIAFVLSVLYVHFRDIKHIYGVFLTLWMYITPIFYTIERLSPKMQTILRLNPMFYFVEYFRTAILYGHVPSIKYHLFIYGIGILSFLVGALIFRAAKKKIILHI